MKHTFYPKKEKEKKLIMKHTKDISYWRIDKIK